VKTPFSPRQIKSLRLGNSEPGALDFWVDDVVLLNAN
jgi:hypothetical protein